MQHHDKSTSAPDRAPPVVQPGVTEGPAERISIPGMTTWPPDWEDLHRGVGCIACVEGRPDRIPDAERFFEGATSDAYLSRSSAARGYTIQFWRGRHAAELTDLRSDELQSFTGELITVCRAVEAQYRPLKLNIFMLGNGLPHLHAHIVPRYWDDPNPGRPPRFMMGDEEWPLIEEADFQSQLGGLRSLLGV